MQTSAPTPTDDPSVLPGPPGTTAGPFTRVPSSPQQPLRVLLAGAGNMGRAWLRTVEAAGVELVGVADLDPAAGRAAVVAVRPDALGGPR